MQPWDNEMSASLVPDFDKGEVHFLNSRATKQPFDISQGASFFGVATDIFNRKHD
jgi:hypothetical protein